MRIFRLTDANGRLYHEAGIDYAFDNWPSNLMQDASFSGGASYWLGGNATVARSTAYSRRGAASLAVTSTTPASFGRYNPPIPITASVSYTMQAWHYAPSSADVYRVETIWYDNSLNVLGTSGSDFVDVSSGWALLQMTAVAPTGATQAEPRVARSITGATGDVCYVDDVRFFASAPSDANFTTTTNAIVHRSEQNVMAGRFSARVVTSANGLYGLDIGNSTAGVVPASTPYFVSALVYLQSGTAGIGAYNSTTAVQTNSDAGRWLRLTYVTSSTTDGKLRFRVGGTTSGTIMHIGMIQIGTVDVEFIDGVRDGSFHIVNWEQQIADFKAGGVFRDSPISDGRQFVGGAIDSVIETVEFKLDRNTSTSNQNDMIRKSRELLQALAKAAQHSSARNVQPDPVYIETRLDRETQMRFAKLIKGRVPQWPDPTSIELQQLVMYGCTMTFERGDWLHCPPGESLSVPLSVSQTYNSVNYGPEATYNPVYITGARRGNNITNYHIGTAAANNIGGTLPHDLFVASAASTYIGINTTLANSGPWFSLVFNIVRAGAGAPTLVWEYWNGSTWASLIILTDETSNFTQTGVKSLVFSFPTTPIDWSPNIPGGSLPMGYYIRCRIASGSWSTIPQQGEQYVYSPAWNSVDIPASALGGDRNPLVDLDVYPASSQMFVGARSLSRGSNFVSAINMADEQNPSWISLSTTGGATYATNVSAPAGRVIAFSTGAIQTVVLTIDETVAEEYIGRFRVFALGDFTNTFTASLNRFSYIPVVDNVPHTAGTVDFGEIEFSRQSSRYGLGDLEITFQFNFTGTGGGSLWAVYFIPSDEWFAEVSRPSTLMSPGDRRVHVDAVSSPGESLCYLTDPANTQSQRPYGLRTNKLPEVPRETGSRLHFYGTGSLLSAIQLRATQRYYAMRGDS